ncbi:MAG: HAD hydrolase-like protein [Planctomycetaceae bacterium]|jgi:phosphoglycolate phosphatase|nr:HAD hydrolase-like protein [Planctomycetaceae bacterium]
MIEAITYSQLELFDCIVFDLDGTLCDTIGDIKRSLADTFLRCDCPMPDMGRLRVGPPLAVMIDELLGGNTDRAFVDKIAAEYREYYESSNYEVSPLYCGVFELILRLKSAGKKLAIATLKREVSTLRLIECRKMDKFFDRIFCCDTGGEMYSKDQMLAQITTQLNIAPANTIFFGDSVSDITAGQKIGVKTVAVLFGYGEPDALIAANPDHICNNYTDLLT